MKIINIQQQVSESLRVPLSITEKESSEFKEGGNVIGESEIQDGHLEDLKQINNINFN